MKKMVAWVLAVLLAAGYAVAALGKLSGAAVPMFEGWGYAPWFAYLIGVVELGAGIGLLIPRFTRASVLTLGVVMMGAGYTHLSNGEGSQVLRPTVFLILLMALLMLRRRVEASEPGSS